jgi:hypothetical protein
MESDLFHSSQTSVCLSRAKIAGVVPAHPAICSRNWQPTTREAVNRSCFEFWRAPTQTTALGAAEAMDRLRRRNPSSRTHATSLKHPRPPRVPTFQPQPASRSLQEPEPSSPGPCLTPTVSRFLFRNLHSFLLYVIGNVFLNRSRNLWLVVEPGLVRLGWTRDSSEV